MTTRGFGPGEMREVTQIILGTLNSEPTEANLDGFLRRSRELTAAFPLYHSLVAR
jgi:glycine/serine hydroxymethyltransferase